MNRKNLVFDEWSRRAWIRAALSGSGAVLASGWLPAAFAQEGAGGK